MKQSTKNLFGYGFWAFCLALLFLWIWWAKRLDIEPGMEIAPGVSYSHHKSMMPWSVHVVRVDLNQPDLEMRSIHAKQGSVGLGNLTSLVRSARQYGRVLAAVNGDFFQTQKEFAGDARGMHIVDGELLSGPNGGVTLWLDPEGRPHVTNVISEFRITWPNGQVTPFGLNEDRRSNNWMVLYTPAVGQSTRTKGGRELVLESTGEEPWLPLHAGCVYTARVREAHEGGDTCLKPDIMVLSLKPTATNKLPVLQPGELLTISTATWPNMLGVKTALSGGPLLVLHGQMQNWKPAELRYGIEPSGGVRSMFERHPRTAVGWNGEHLLLMVVDGRQANRSIGMTLKEVSKYMMRLGCQTVMNLDGGGSAMMWCNGQIVNRPSDKKEREIANALVVLRKGVKEDITEMTKYYWGNETNKWALKTNPVAGDFKKLQ